MLIVTIIALALFATGVATATGLIIYTCIKMNQGQNEGEAPYLDNSEFDWGHNVNNHSDDE